MRLLVCGGRDFTDRAWLWRELDAIHAARPIALIIHGGARGADALAGGWAEARRIAYLVMPADWDTHGKRAGHIRNAEMLEWNPDAVLAAPGGRGTANMIELAERAGVYVEKMA